MPIIQGFIDFSILGCTGCLVSVYSTPGALDSYRDRINSLLVSIWVFPQLNISLRVRVFIPGFLLTLPITSTLFF